jgi:hypothetical protein
LDQSVHTIVDYGYLAVIFVLGVTAVNGTLKTLREYSPSRYAGQGEKV